VAITKPSIQKTLIPFSFSSAANQLAVGAINAAIAQFHQHSCIRFINSKDKYYINFFRGIGYVQ